MSKKPKVIIPNETSKYALLYINTDPNNRKERDRLFMLVAECYKPLLYKWIDNYDIGGRDRDEIEQIYYYEVLKALNKWSQTKANFKTYLYPYVISVLRQFMGIKRFFKKDITCGLIEDIEDYEEPFYNEDGTYFDTFEYLE